MEGTGRETVVKNRFTKSIGTGIGALTNGGKEFYVLEHKSNTKNFRAGQQKEVIVDYIELGRDYRCGIKFSENEKTISRRHAAITKENGNWVLLNLSKTNPTLLNGRPVNKRFYITTGDEIQLSTEGPRLGFIVPNNNKTGSLSIGKRMTLFGEQALRPYKRAIWALTGLIVLISLASGFFIYQLNEDKAELMVKVQDVQKQLKDTVSITEKRAEELVTKNQQLLRKSNRAQKRVKDLNRKIASMTAPVSSPGTNSSSPPNNSSANTPTALSALHGDVFLIQVSKVKVTKSDGDVVEADQMKWQGTGFLTKDHRFITARHVVEPWFYPMNVEDNLNLIDLNVIIHNFGATIELELNAVSSSGRKLRFHLKDFKIDRSGDLKKEIEYEDQNYLIKHAGSNPNDIAWAKVDEIGMLETNAEKSRNLQATTELYVLSFPFGIGASDPSNQMSPIYSTSTVGRAGLENNTIITTNNSIASGSSGGPVFIRQGGRYQVIGVVSGGWGEQIGKIVPISLIY